MAHGRTARLRLREADNRREAASADRAGAGGAVDLPGLWTPAGRRAASADQRGGRPQAVGNLAGDRCRLRRGREIPTGPQRFFLVDDSHANPSIRGPVMMGTQALTCPRNRGNLRRGGSAPNTSRGPHGRARTCRPPARRRGTWPAGERAAPQAPPLLRQRFRDRAPVVEMAQRQVRLQLRDDHRVERRPALDRQPRTEHQVADVLHTPSTEPFSSPCPARRTPPGTDTRPGTPRTPRSAPAPGPPAPA